ncbi:MAG TPA: sigma 54-interacting transcriptional regulator [Thermodesulfobacteriota bacterium]|nr:sigma 54-interacting transcriptional regulator [Thermodesulfobacteriota bacterium]
MGFDENDFFRRATMQVLSSLDIEVAMWRALKFLREFIPADMMFLHLYQRDLGAMRTIAMATPSEGKKIDRLHPLTKEVRTRVEERHPHVMILNEPELDPLGKNMFQHFGTLDASGMVLHLDVEGERLGALSLVAMGRGKFSEEHARLMSLLNEPFAIAFSHALQHQEVLKLKDLLADDNRYLHRELFHLSGDEIVGADFALKGVMAMARQVASLNSPVLLLGETGVGKDVIANAIHYSSPRKDGPFVKVNCGAIPETLLDSELFGHEKGAFTGAISQKRGRFERADHGTIFLDEIGELPPQAQVRMLRVLQDKEIERVGGTISITLDIRLIAATNRNLEEMVKEKKFREDLWFRLNVFPIRIPPLRERKEDIPALVRHFVGRKSRELKLAASPSLARGAIDQLLAYHWPGNVRELENVVERALILSKGEPLAFDDLLGAKSGDRPPAAATPQGQSLNLDEVVSLHIQRVLEMTKGKVHGKGGAAEVLGINPSTLRNRMNQLGIPYGRRARA